MALKGETIIELTNVTTGEVEVHRDTNMVTNALQEIIKPVGYIKRADGFLNYDSSATSPYVSYYLKALGGLLMFDGKLPEDVNQLYPPCSLNLTACATYNVTNDTADQVRGDYNSTESLYTSSERKMKFVYDFKTNQGNGTISSVALTHRLGSFNPWASSNGATGKSYLFLDCYVNTARYIGTNSTNTSIGTSSSLFSNNLPYCISGRYTAMSSKPEILFLIDPTNDVVWTMQIVSTTEINIYKRQANFNSFSIFTTPQSSHKLISTTTVTLNTALTNTDKYHSIYYDIEKGALYILNSGSATISNGSSFTITEIMIPSCTVQQYSFTNNTDISIIGGHFLIRNNVLYISGESSYRASDKSDHYIRILFKCNNITSSQDLEEIKSFDTTDYSYHFYPILSIGDNIILQYYNDNSNIMSIKGDDTTVITGQCIYPSSVRYLSYVPVLDNPLLFYKLSDDLSNSGYCMCNNYLATINNLTTPVIKTADTTMKVTYTIQETNYM